MAKPSKIVFVKNINKGEGYLLQIGGMTVSLGSGLGLGDF